MSKRVNYTLKYNEDIEKALKHDFPNLKDFRIITKGLDARGADRGKPPRFNYIVEIIEEGEDFSQNEEVLQKFPEISPRPIIIGAGPAGLFCALRFVEHGIPVTLIERGKPAGQRMLDIAKFWRYGVLNPESNVCYGEGGAGLYSDGKLITRIKSDYVQYVMNKFVQFGAPEETAYTTNPHLGSNKIRNIISELTKYLVERNCEILYNTKVEQICFQNKRVTGIKTRDGKHIESSHVILATGHSASDMYKHLHDESVEMKAKSFAVGVRVEHPRAFIDYAQHGSYADSKYLGAARYKLKHHDKNTHRGTYSFCMCPGGYVLSSGTESDGIVVNGMSNYARNSRWSNSAIVVTVNAERDLSSDDILSGLKFQQDIEKKAYGVSEAKASGRELPTCTVEEFLSKKIQSKKVLPKTSSPSGIFKTDLHEILPNFINEHLEKALVRFDKQVKGFAMSEALMIAPETRTSAPITIPRDTKMQSTSHQGLYPCGEGAGHAGGITSAAVDGIKVANAIIESVYSKNGSEENSIE